MESLQKIRQEFNSDLSKYCLNECSTPCCMLYGTCLTLEREEFVFIFESKIKKSLTYKILKHCVGGDKAFDRLINRKLKKHQHGEDSFVLWNAICPSYDAKTRKCNIHESENRPLGCKSFPLSGFFGWGIDLDSRCGYIQENWEKISSFLKDNFPKEKIRVQFFQKAGFLTGLERPFLDVEEDREMIAQRMKEVPY